MIELLIAIAVAAVVMLMTITLLRFLARMSSYEPVAQGGALIAKELLESVIAAAEGSWQSVANAASGNPYYVNKTASGFVVAPGVETVTVNDIAYTRSFSVAPVLRDAVDAIAPAGVNDPSTKKIIVTVSWSYLGQPQALAVEQYIARTRNEALAQTDWIGGPTCPGSDPVVSGTNNRFCSAITGAVDYTSQPGSIKIYGY